jgi:hypothetical protein
MVGRGMFGRWSKWGTRPWNTNFHALKSWILAILLVPNDMVFWLFEEYWYLSRYWVLESRWKLYASIKSIHFNFYHMTIKLWEYAVHGGEWILILELYGNFIGLKFTVSFEGCISHPVFLKILCDRLFPVKLETSFLFYSIDYGFNWVLKKFRI